MSFGKPAWAVNSRQGPRRRHKKLVFFACEGLVALYDERATKEDYLVILPDEFYMRAFQLSLTAKRMLKEISIPWMCIEGRQWLADCQRMETTVKEAKEMGDPSDHTVQAFWRRHRHSTYVNVDALPDTYDASLLQLPGLHIPATGVPILGTQVAVVPTELKQVPVKRSRNPTPVTA